MKQVLFLAAALTLVGAPLALAQDHDHDHGGHQGAPAARPPGGQPGGGHGGPPSGGFQGGRPSGPPPGGFRAPPQAGQARSEGAGQGYVQPNRQGLGGPYRGPQGGDFRGGYGGQPGYRGGYSDQPGYRGGRDGYGGYGRGDPRGGPGFHGPGQFSYRGRTFSSFRASPFRYPPGFGYRRWYVGAYLPGLFLGQSYFIGDWDDYDLGPPPPGEHWVRYGPDALLVNNYTGEVDDVAYGVFYE